MNRNTCLFDLLQIQLSKKRVKLGLECPSALRFYKTCKTQQFRLCLGLEFKVNLFTI